MQEHGAGPVVEATVVVTTGAADVDVATGAAVVEATEAAVVVTTGAAVVETTGAAVVVALEQSPVQTIWQFLSKLSPGTSARTHSTEQEQAPVVEEAAAGAVVVVVISVVVSVVDVAVVVSGSVVEAGQSHSHEASPAPQPITPVHSAAQQSPDG